MWVQIDHFYRRIWNHEIPVNHTVIRQTFPFLSRQRGRGLGNKGLERLRHLIELVLLVQLLALPSVGTAEGAGEETVRKYTLFACIHC